jgi:hypothetical protein
VIITDKPTRRCPRCKHSMSIDWVRGVQTWVCGDSDCGHRERSAASRAMRRLGAWPPSAAIDAALSLCRGDYQRAIVLGEQRWSGSDLRGEARNWSSRYKLSRDHVMARCTAASIPWHIDTRAHGLLVLAWGTA